MADKLLTQYREGCARLQALGRKPPFRHQRLDVYKRLVQTHGAEAVLRHVGWIRDVLDAESNGREGG